MQRIAQWLLLLVVALQLVGDAFHHHKLADDDRNCPACYMSLHAPAAMPTVVADVAATPLLFRYLIHPQPIYRFVARQSYLIPQSQAPPSAVLPA